MKIELKKTIISDLSKIGFLKLIINSIITMSETTLLTKYKCD